jgi:hypothetical protein
MRRRRRFTDADIFDDPDPDVDYLRDRLAESFSELETLREEAARYHARAMDLESRLKEPHPPAPSPSTERGSD